jgi:hypothetical protein
MTIRIFISHASADRDLVKCFVSALEASVQITEGAIRCTSLPGYRLRAGAHTSTKLREELQEAELIIGILTPASLESGWVMFELGAGWGAGKWVVPVVAGIDYDTMPGPLKESNATDAATRGELEELFHEIADGLKVQRRAAGKASAAIDELVEEAESYFEDDDSDESEDDDDDDDD